MGSLDGVAGAPRLGCVEFALCPVVQAGVALGPTQPTDILRIPLLTTILGVTTAVAAVHGVARGLAGGEQ